MTTVNFFLTNTVNAVKEHDVLSLEKVFKNTVKLLEKLKAAGLNLYWTVYIFLEDLGLLMNYLSGKDITIDSNKNVVVFLFTILNIFT